MTANLYEIIRHCIGQGETDRNATMHSLGLGPFPNIVTAVHECFDDSNPERPGRLITNSHDRDEAPPLMESKSSYVGAPRFHGDIERWIDAHKISQVLVNADDNGVSWGTVGLCVEGYDFAVAVELHSGGVEEVLATINRARMRS